VTILGALLRKKESRKRELVTTYSFDVGMREVVEADETSSSEEGL
jgi:hypothetical protein